MFLTEGWFSDARDREKVMLKPLDAVPFECTALTLKSDQYLI
jgi:hypothetical protein